MKNLDRVYVHYSHPGDELDRSKFIKTRPSTKLPVIGYAFMARLRIGRSP